jgi:hypothetical protein
MEAVMVDDSLAMQQQVIDRARQAADLALQGARANALSQYQNLLGVGSAGLTNAYRPPVRPALRNSEGQTVWEWLAGVERGVEQYKAAGVAPSAYVAAIFEEQCAEWLRLNRR